MLAYYADHYELPLPSGHRFPMAKYRMLREAISAELPEIELQEAPRSGDIELQLAHTPSYIGAVSQGRLSQAQQREIGFPWSPAMVERSRRSVGGTVAAAFSAMQFGVSANLAGGTHHAYADQGGGFCVFNDLAVAARSAQAHWRQSHSDDLRVLILDLDVHQGNGTARIFRGDPTVFTVSLHGDKNFPFRKESSDLDVSLPDGCGDEDYLQVLERTLCDLQRRFRPGLVMYQAGVDPYVGDRLGRLCLSAEGLRQRDQRVLTWCEAQRCAVAMTMGGGYASRIEETIGLQLNTFREALASWRRWHNLAHD